MTKAGERSPFTTPAQARLTPFSGKVTMACELSSCLLIGAAVTLSALLRVSDHRGITGIGPTTWNRLDPSVAMHVVESSGHYVVAPEWKADGALPLLPP